MIYIKTFEKIELNLNIGSYYSFNSNYNKNKKYLVKLIDYNGITYTFAKIEDLEYSPFRYYNGSSDINKFTVENWITHNNFKEEPFFRMSTDPELWKNINKFNI